MGGLAVAAGVGIGHLVLRPGNWWHEASILDADYASGRFYWNGQTFSDEAAFNLAIGATRSGGQRVIGPYVDPASPELVLNGDFAGNTLANWTTVLNGGSTADALSGYARFVSDGTTGNGVGGAGITQSFATVLDKAYRVLFSNPSVGTVGSRIGGTTPTGAGALARSVAPGGSTLSTWSALGTTSYMYPYRNGTGTAGADNISVKECLPFKGFAQGGFTARLRGVTPAVASGTKVALALSQIHDTEVGARVDLRYTAAGELHVIASYPGVGTVADLNLGAVAGATPFDVWFGAAPNDFRAILNNGPSIGDTSGGLPGFGAMYVGRDITGNNWDGGELQVQLFAGGGVDRLYGLLGNALHFEGDSFAGGAYGVVLPSTLNALMSRPVYNTGVGGNTMDQISARLVAATAETRAKTTIVWDGDQNGITTVSAYCDLLAAGLAALGHSRFVVVPPCTNYGQSDISQEVAIRDEMEARWPNNLLDWRGVLTFSAPNQLDASMYAHPSPDPLNDATHLSQAAMDLMAAAIKTFIEAKGW